MSVCLFVLICSAISSALGSVVRPIASNRSCSENQFTCLDGLCISADQVCDASLDCSDGSDEHFCLSSSTNVTTGEGFGRFKRQSTCPKLQRQCKDGTCISSDEICDGAKNCADGSDETHALCRKTSCPPHLFRCTYGACVDGTAPCDHKVDCVDSSDELIPRCRGATGLTSKEFICLEGGLTIPPGDLCDGNPNCPDGSDETVRVCGELKCPGNLFQCAYGACVDGNSDCNGVQDCADGSDEAADLCNRTVPLPLAVPPRINVPDHQPGKCQLPLVPLHARYENVSGGINSQYLRLTIRCEEGYGGIEKPDVLCVDGTWSVQPFPDCRRICKLEKHPSVSYKCQVATKGIVGTRACKEEELSGTIVEPTCNKAYYSSRLYLMKCGDDGEWDRIVTCQVDCGRLASTGDGLVSGGWLARRGELPWHVAIYQKPTKSQNYYKQICGGSLVSNSVVITAAHCFWTDKLRKASEFAVAAAKLYREWDHPEDAQAQKSDVKELYVPSLFQGGDLNYQEDIAIVILETPVEYHLYVLPVCLSFDHYFFKVQMKPGTLGKVAGWGLTGELAGPSQVLKVVDLPYVSDDDCLAMTPLVFRESITGDKICAGYSNGTAVCSGDSGGGLAFPDIQQGKQRFYLRGIVSSSPKPGDTKKHCNIFTVTTFTNVLRQQFFINNYL
uniref:Peptidase S1 domain-containing protein n=1 Tax=Heliothis virescens TaxID=7102 RepID=A0A2A4J8A8_HELVI